ncbi:MAG: hypothetical protein IPP83_03190 [Flavobacteriales bacterium]|nr:hypothetical protein [Flavobacteriales bacterium]
MGLTGTKIGCSGQREACTVLVDGEPVLSCITPAMRFVVPPSPPSRDFPPTGNCTACNRNWWEGAVHCGFCTPGRVLTALTMWAASRTPTWRDRRRSPGTSAAAGYKKIVEAVAEYAKEQHHGVVPPVAAPAGMVARAARTSRRLARHRASPTTPTTSPEERPVCEILRSPHAHAHILGIDASEAMRLPGVHYVLPAPSCPSRSACCRSSQDETAMALGKTRHRRDTSPQWPPDTEATATKPLALLVTCRTTPSGLPHHGRQLGGCGVGEKIHAYTRHGNNAHKKVSSRDSISAGLKDAEVVSAMTFSMEGVNFGFSEPHAANAFWDENGLTSTTATQVTLPCTRALAKKKCRCTGCA